MATTYVVEIKGDLTFEVSVDSEGTPNLEGGWFDCRSAENGLTASVYRAPEGTLVVDAATIDFVLSATPGKGEMLAIRGNKNG